MIKNILTILLLTISFQVFGQSDTEVFRIEQLNYNTAVYNIFVDKENNKQVSTNEGLFTVYGKELADLQESEPGKQSLLSFKGGNENISWSKAAMDKILSTQNTSSSSITTATYDDKKEELWVGTAENGVFRIKYGEGLQLLEHLSSKNTKLQSDKINIVHVDNFDRVWIGSRFGVLVGEDGRWNLEEKFISIENIAEEGPELWVLGQDNFIWKVDMRGKWEEFYIDEEWVEGSAKDLDVDGKGWLWIASEVITGYDVVADSFIQFGPAQYFTSQFTNCITVDFEGNVWVGTDDKGLYMIENEPGMAVVAYAENFVSCDGTKPDASIILKVASGEPPYNIQWDNGLQGYNPKNLGPGTYKVIVVDNRGKKKIAVVVIPKPKMDITATVEKMESKIGKEDGVVSINIKGGVPGYEIQWDNGEIGMRAENLAGGKHTITVTDQNNCTAVAEVNVGQNLEELQVDLVQTAKNECYTDKKAAIEATVIGGKPPYQYTWNNPLLKGTNPQNLVGGEYSLIVTDAAGNKKESSITLDQPDPLNAKVSIDANATANEQDGKASITIAGGEEKYQVAWSNGEKGTKATNLGPGAYSVTVTDAVGCVDIEKFEITEDILPLEITLEVLQTNKCSGEATVALDLNVKGGKKPYRYVWNDASISAENLSGLKAGNYKVSVYDASNNFVRADLQVEDPTPLILGVKNISSANTDAADGEAMAMATGGTGKYSYQWDSGETTKTAKTLPAGKHTVTVTDESGCSAIGNVEITEDILPLNLTINQTEFISCNGDNSGAIQAIVTGGKKPHNFKWDDPSLSGAEFSGLSAGKYQLTVTDAMGSQISKALTVNEPSAIQLEVQVDQPASTDGEDGQARVVVSGGTGKYTINWDNDESGTIAKKLKAGEHAVTVTDENGCSAIGDVEITEDILPLNLTINQTEFIPCNGDNSGAIEAIVAGGKKPHNFKWDDPSLSGAELSGLSAGKYQLTVTDAMGSQISKTLTVNEPSVIKLEVQVDQPASTDGEDGQARVVVSGGTGKYTINWDNGENGTLAKKLKAGEHAVTVTDENGCEENGSVEITENILPLSLTLNQSAAIKCNGEQTAAIEAIVSGGKPPFKYQWKDSKLSGTNPDGLGAGNYKLTVIDVAENELSKDIFIEEPAPLKLEIEVDQSASTGESDGQARAIVSGGAGEYTFAWDNGETSVRAEKLSPGIRTVTVKDNNGCSISKEVEITENILPLKATLVQTEEIKCFGSAGGSLQVNISGGKKPYAIQWNDSRYQGETIQYLPAGEYAVSVTDASGQNAEASFTAKEPQELTAQIKDIRPTTNNRTTDGKAILVAAGGKLPYSIKWDSEETGEKAVDLNSGSHQVTLTDANDCQKVFSFEVRERIIPELNVDLLNEGSTIRMKTLTFMADSTDLDESSIPVLDEVYYFLVENPGIIVEIGGHTNTVPEAAFCDRLSTQRAKAVVNYLLEKGIPEKRLTYKGYGKRKPLVRNDKYNMEARKRNQRVEIKILRLDSD